MVMCMWLQVSRWCVGPKPTPDKNPWHLWLQVQQRWAMELDAALPPAAVEALLARALLKRRRLHRRQLRCVRPSALLRSLGGAAYFSACWAWGRRARGVTG